MRSPFFAAVLFSGNIFLKQYAAEKWRGVVRGGAIPSRGASMARFAPVVCHRLLDLSERSNVT